MLLWITKDWNRGPLLIFCVRRAVCAAAFLVAGETAQALNPSYDAGSYLLQGWSPDDGLPANRVRCVYQSNDGYVWVATAQGLARFDGNRFVSFSPATQPELPTSNFYYVVAATDKTIWGASNNGLFHFDGHTFTRFGSEQGLANNYVRTVAVLRDGTVVAGTGSGISLVRNGQVVPLPDPLKQITGVVRCVWERKDGSVLFAAQSGLWRLTGNQVELLSGKGGLPAAIYWSVAEGPDGSVWLGTNQGLHRLGPDGIVTHFGVPDGLPTVAVQCLRFDHNGNLWIGTTAGLCRWYGGTIQKAGYADAFGSTTVSEIIETKEGGLLLATNAGLFELSDTPISAIDHHDGLDQAVVNTVIETRDGAYVLGLWSGGIYRYVNRRAAPVATTPNTSFDFCSALCEDSESSLWVGGDNLLARHRGDHWENFHLGNQAAAWRQKLAKQPDLELPGIAHDRIYCIVADPAGGLWIGAQGGLYHSRENGFTIAPSTLGLWIKSVLCTRDGDVWATSQKTTLRFHDGQWKPYPCLDGKVNRICRNLAEDSVGTVWVTLENGGLARYTGVGWRIYTRRDGLTDDNATGLIEDDLGYLWIGTARGVMRIARANFDAFDAGRIAKLSPQIFAKRDGMPDSECNETGGPSAWKTRSGLLLFPTFRGAAVIDPRNIFFNQQKPPVIIEDAFVNSTRVDLAHKLSLPPDHTDLQFHYTATSLLAPGRVQFKVKLSPVDTDWVEVGGRRDIRYHRLAPGSYEFHVIACNNNGVWNEQGAGVAFIVRPFFYQTIWFYAGIALAGTSIVLTIFRWRVRRLRRRAIDLQHQNTELEQRVNERTLELERSNQALRASEYFYHSLVESLPQIIIRKDAAGRVTYSNAGGADLLGCPLDQIVGKTDADLLAADVAAQSQAQDAQLMQVGKPLEYEYVVAKEGKPKQYLHVKKVPLFDEQRRPIGLQMLCWDMTLFRETEAQLREAQKELIETSRRAGMAEVATGVLHNIGNALNSVNTSASLLSSRVKQMRTSGIAQVAQMLMEERAQLAEFFTSDSRSKKIPEYLVQFSTHLRTEQGELGQELDTLTAGINHITAIVAAQQSIARVAGVVENFAPSELVEFALRVSEASLSRHGISVTREIERVPNITIDRQKALQILVNLLGNAKESCNESERADKHIVVSLRLQQGRIRIAITDNGGGIAPENLTRIFAFGFTTKTTGNSFGLHSSALAAKELGGTLVAESAGLGKGATFVLEFPATQSTD
jgi:PAS domain S-box-containing protein